MEPLTTLDAIAVPLADPNIDTDQIIPARYLWRKRDDGWSDLLLHDLRYDDKEAPRPGFILNDPRYAGARIVVAAENFGCGSSREHAVWCLADYGIRVVVAPSFGDIFANNCYQNGLLPIVLANTDVTDLFAHLAAAPGVHVEIDLPRQTVRWDAREAAFEITPFRKACLIAGTDAIGLTLGYNDAISHFESELSSKCPWL